MDEIVVAARVMLTSSKVGKASVKLSTGEVLSADLHKDFRGAKATDIVGRLLDLKLAVQLVG